ncbi:hypothetical protein QTP70_015950 [Hemibagrus guttatus]|uniref:Reverse transcriptase domain-containing protein n=1 Tax=Hemibagrus guttatus TaxID=175788 RepID=A0AAE0PVX9_9TELE|nr:hypothetical protein QTP70_015950 [Hemibagrus guttatus]
MCSKTRRGGLCVYINAEWFKNSVLVSSWCSPLVEFVTVRCRPFYLPREFTTIFIVGVYIPPSANAKEALCELYGAISELQNAHPDGLFIIARDFNHTNLKSVLPKFHQYVDQRRNHRLGGIYVISDQLHQQGLRAGDKDALRTARAKLSQAIREAKRAHSQRIHGHFQSSSDTCMWQGIQSITNYRPASPACDSDASLLDALNSFYARFEARNDVTVRKTIPPTEDQVLGLTMVDMRKTLRRVNPRKAAGPDNIPGRVPRECKEQLADVITDIFNISLSSAVVPTCLKTTTIIPVPKKSPVSCLNDYVPVTLTPIIMKCFEWLVMRHIENLLPPSLDPMQFAYRPNCSTDDTIDPASGPHTLGQ